MRAAKHRSITGVAIQARELKAQFEGLDFRNAPEWPVLPKAVLYVAIAAITLFVAWSLYLRDMHAQLEQARATEQTQQKDFENKLQKSVSLDGLKKQREQVQQYVMQLEQQLPNRSEVVSLLSDINQAGVGRHLHFEQLKPGSEVVKDYYAELPIAVRVSGSFAQIARFAADVAQLPRIVTLSNLVFTPKSDDGILLLEATVKTYRYLDQEEIQAQQKMRQNSKKGP